MNLTRYSSECGTHRNHPEDSMQNNNNHLIYHEKRPIISNLFMRERVKQKTFF